MLNVAGMTLESNQHGGWRDLWSIRAPPKVKHLLWRISRECLPTRLRLQDKQVPCPLLCPICNQENEEDWHVFFDFEASIYARQSAGLDQVVLPQLQQHPNLRDLIFFLFVLIRIAILLVCLPCYFMLYGQIGTAWFGIKLKKRDERLVSRLDTHGRIGTLCSKSNMRIIIQCNSNKLLGGKNLCPNGTNVMWMRHSIKSSIKLVPDGVYGIIWVGSWWLELLG
jgi:hypothetical protein